MITNPSMIPYKSYRYLYPPRAEKALPSSSIEQYDNHARTASGYGIYGAQPKLNGDCMLIFTNGIETIVKNRHKENFKKTITMMEDLKRVHRETLDGTKNKWMVLVGEYMIKSKMNADGKVWNNKFVIFDIIVYDGMQLLGTTFEERQTLLDQLYGKEDASFTRGMNDERTGVYDDKFIYATSMPNIHRVRTFKDCLSALWNDLVKIDMYEGLVFKRASAKLENGLSENNNTLSQVKIRKETKNYKW